MTIAKCERCKYYKLEGSLCRRYPPSSPTLSVVALHPVVSPDDWCGEYDAAPTKERKQKPTVKSAMDLVFGTYIGVFTEVFGAAPVLTAADRKAAKNMIDALGAETAADVVAMFLKDPPAWNKEKGLFDLRFIQGKANEILARKKLTSRSDDMIDFLKSQIEHRGSGRWYEYVDYVKKSGKLIPYLDWAGV